MWRLAFDVRNKTFQNVVQFTHIVHALYFGKIIPVSLTFSHYLTTAIHTSNAFAKLTLVTFKYQQNESTIHWMRCLRTSCCAGGVLPSKRLLGMCRLMGSHFNNWTDYNGVTFLVELLEWGRKFSGFLG